MLINNREFLVATSSGCRNDAFHFKVGGWSLVAKMAPKLKRFNCSGDCLKPVICSLLCYSRATDSVGSNIKVDDVHEATKNAPKHMLFKWTR